MVPDREVSSKYEGSYQVQHHLAARELKLVVALQARLKAKSKVEVVRRGLRLLDETTERARLRDAYRRASLATRTSLAKDLAELDGPTGEGLEDR